MTRYASMEETELFEKMKQNNEVKLVNVYMDNEGKLYFEQIKEVNEND